MSDRTRIALLVRHAKAVDREYWFGDDRQRPLTKEGEAQAKRLAEALARENIGEVRTSPAVRCVETLRPLAMRLGLTPFVDEDLMEGGAINLLRAWNGALVICAHGDNIPAFLAEAGVECDECRKASTWRVTLDACGRVIHAQYVPPPTKR